MKTIFNLDLTEYNSYRVHSKAAIAMFPESVDDFKEICNNYCVSDSYIIGKGCNTVFVKETYPESQPLIFVRENFSGIDSKDGIISVLAGTDLKDLSIYALEHSYSGLEYFYDIPGCVGGAITMKAGSCGISFSDYIQNITFLECESQKIQTIDKSDINAGYRDSLFKGNKKNIILSCTLKLPGGIKEKIKERMDEIVLKRQLKQPREFPNAGSVFIRPSENVYVGPMIEKLGLKGYRIGGAEVSTKHAGFIVNVDNATGQDILKLINYIKDMVNKNYGINLQVEQRILV